MTYLLTSWALFVIGLTIVVSKKNTIVILMGIELMLNAANVNFAYFSQFDPNPEQGHSIVLMVLLVATAEISIGLAILLKIREYYQSINPDDINLLKK